MRSRIFRGSARRTSGTPIEQVRFNQRGKGMKRHLIRWAARGAFLILGIGNAGEACEEYFHEKGDASMSITLRPLVASDVDAFLTWGGDPTVTQSLFWDH